MSAHASPRDAAVTAFAVVVALASGCAQSPRTQGPSVCVPSRVEGTCDAPALLDPDDVFDVHSYRRLASQAVCDLGLRCPEIGIEVVTSPYCHPAYAELEAARSNAIEPARFDLAAARRCVEALARVRCIVALDLAIRCHDVALGFAVDHLAGATCIGDDCALGLVCIEGRCAEPPREGHACPVGVCEAGLTCVDGVCARARDGESCALTECDEGLFCAGTAYGPPFCAPIEPEACTGPPVRHVGCPCGDAQGACPTDVSVCRAGVCVLRPFRGEACEPGGAPCYASLCDGAYCRPLETGEGPCGGDADCAAGLVCGTGPIFSFVSGLCGPTIALGATCGTTTPGRCADGTVCSCGSSPCRCVPAASR